MKTQISRISDQPKKNFNAVYQQQGRMLTDADWNEMNDLNLRDHHQLGQAVISSGMPGKNGLEFRSDRKIIPGIVFADGVRARLSGTAPMEYADQVDLPHKPALPLKNVCVYADIWSRTITALHDKTLMDSALHGADTCTRTQQMVQIKWCPISMCPIISDTSPFRGDARVSLALRKIEVSQDPCNPCTQSLDIDERIGNFLFRVEVHDQYLASGKTFLVLKWSRDNGAEQYEVNHIPTGFASGNTAYEFFDNNTEKNAGLHLCGNSRVRRGELSKTFTLPTGSGKPVAFVRQWDGFATLNLTDTLLVKGTDMGHPLSTGYLPDAHGYVTIDPGQLSINGELLTIKVTLGASCFVPGDFWVAPVREAEQEPGDFVLGTATGGKPPNGIHHHYIELGQIDNTGTTVPLTDEKSRAMAFPTLTDIRAKDIGFTQACPSLYQGAQNVQTALDALCELNAGHVGYTPATCSGISVKSLLSTTPGWPDVDTDGKVAVKDILDALLCQLTAKTLPLDKSSSTCPELTIPSIKNVQDAIERLCEMERFESCAITVGKGGRYKTLAEVLDLFANDSQWQHIWLALLPGEHLLSTNQAITGKGSIKITGHGVEASSILFTAQSLSLSARQVQTQDVRWRFSKPIGQLSVRTSRLILENSDVVRVGNNENNPVLFTCAPQDTGSFFSISNATISSTFRAPAMAIDEADIAPVDVHHNTAINTLLKALLDDGALISDTAAFDCAVEKVKDEIKKLSPEKRTLWKRVKPDEKLAELDMVDWGFKKAVVRTTPVRMTASRPATASFDDSVAVAVAKSSRKTEVNSFYDVVGDMTSSDAAIKAGIKKMVRAVTKWGTANAFSIETHHMGGTINQSKIKGTLILNGAISNYATIGNTDKFTGITDEISASYVAGGEDLFISQSSLSRITSLVPATSLAGQRLNKKAEGQGHCNISHCTIEDRRNSIIALTVTLVGNTFKADSEECLTILAHLMTASTNSAEHDPAQVRYLTRRQRLGENIWNPLKLS